MWSECVSDQTSTGWSIEVAIDERIGEQSASRAGSAKVGLKIYRSQIQVSWRRPRFQALALSPVRREAY